MLGAAQIDWLIKALKYSDAAFKLIAVGGQVLNDGAVFENYSTYPDEQKELLRRIEMEGIKNVVFLTGDRHFSQLSTLVFMDGRKVHDLTVSPFTSGVYSPTEINSLMVDGTLVVEQNFGTLTFTGAKNERTMKIQIFNTKGEQLWEKAIEQEK